MPLFAKTNPADVDPFLVDPQADDPAHSFDVPLSTRSGPAHIASLEQLADEVRTGVPTPAPVPAEPKQEDQPESFDVEGGTITIQKTKSGWEGVLESDEGGGKETFRGSTKNELMVKVLSGKLNATRQIRKLNKKLKMVPPTDPIIEI